jgi:hypothetical protein
VLLSSSWAKSFSLLRGSLTFCSVFLISRLTLLREKPFLGKLVLRTISVRTTKILTCFRRYVYQSEKRYNDNDGLIFTPENQPFKAVGLNGIFKWKWPNLQTVDFLLRVEERTNKFGNISKDFVLYLQGNGGLLIKFQKAKFPNDIRKRIWRILEERDSKEVRCSLPNCA